jgi:hypothetical protein
MARALTEPPVELAALAPAGASANAAGSDESAITIIPWVIEHDGSLRVAENPPKGPETGANQSISENRVFA